MKSVASVRGTEHAINGSMKRQTMRCCYSKSIASNAIRYDQASPLHFTLHNDTLRWRRRRSRSISRTSHTIVLKASADATALGDDAEQGGEDEESTTFAMQRDVMDSSRLKRSPKIYNTSKGEKLLFQFGESMRRFELPENTRVILKIKLNN